MSLAPIPTRQGKPHPASEIADPLDESRGCLGLGRSLTFPFPQWRARDRHRTVFFDEGAGDPLVLVHGVGGNATHWELLARELVPRRRVMGLDLVGSGWSAKPEVEYTLELMRDHLLSFLDYLGLERGVTLVGHSLGAAVCTTAALARPERFDGLAVLAPVCLWPLPAWIRVAAPAVLRGSLMYPFFRFTPRRLLASSFVDRDRDNPHVRWFLDSTARDEPGGPNVGDMVRVTASQVRQVTRCDLSGRLPELRLPVLALGGADDRLTAPQIKRLRGIRRLRKVLLPHCGHVPMVERPAQTLEHLERFLRDPP
jgi:pimeloyl-ACP methyl ester carboxylesterase